MIFNPVVKKPNILTQQLNRKTYLTTQLCMFFVFLARHHGDFSYTRQPYLNKSNNSKLRVSYGKPLENK